MNKYREGKLKSTLKRESKDRETVQSISRWRMDGLELGPWEGTRSTGANGSVVEYHLFGSLRSGLRRES